MKLAFLVKTLCFGLAPVGVALNSAQDQGAQDASLPQEPSAQHAQAQPLPPGSHQASWNVLLAAVQH